MSKNDIDFKTIELVSSEPNLEFEIHFNLWMLKKKSILDIGLMCPIIDKSYNVEIVFPKADSKKNSRVICLNNKVRETNIACIIFNCDVSIEDIKNNYKKAKKNNEEQLFVISDYDSGVPNNIDEILEKTEGKIYKKKDQDQTVICFNVVKKSNCALNGEDSPDYRQRNDEFQQKLSWEYFRVRIEDFDLSPFSVCKESKSNFMVPAYECNTVYDFRVNDLKLMSSDERSKWLEKSVYFSKSHFFLINDVSCKVSIVDPSAKVRLFETKNWKEYQDNQDFEPMLAYHMSKIKEGDKKITSASFLIKNGEMKIKWWCILVYLAITFLLGMVGSCTANKISFGGAVENVNVVEDPQNEE